MKANKVARGGPRAYDVGGFGVGCGVPRIRLIGRQWGSSEYFVGQITSRHCYGFGYGETIRATGRDLFDKARIISGPRCISQGRAWRTEAEKLPLYIWIDRRGYVPCAADGRPIV
jgi:hypothetical protein